MGKKAVETKKKKKKGRPSLLDLQKRNLRLQQQQQHSQKSQKHNPNPNPYLRFPNANLNRRSNRRNPNFADVAEEEDEDDDSAAKKRREKKLRLVLQVPPRSSLSSRGIGRSDEESDSDSDARLKKRKVDDVGGSDPEDRDLNDRVAWEKTERHKSVAKATDRRPGTPHESGPSMPLPDKKLLVFVLDRIQKKDTYGVFSEPVDANELPDYREVIEHPMDFRTVRKKLASGAYANLDQFEKDVFLICSNAMRYNAPDTIYYRQARSMQELARKDFENLRQDSEDNEPEIKSVRRGRPPGKNSIKRMMGRLPIDRVGSDFSSDATLATAGENAIWSNSISRKAILSDKLGTADVSARVAQLSRNGEAYGWSDNHKSERRDDFSGVDNVGTVSASLVTYASILALNPDLIINAGTAGGFKAKGACIGDVFLGSDVAFHDRRIPIPVFDQYGIGARKTFCPPNMVKELNLKVGKLSTGDSLDMSPQDEASILANDAAIKDMEGAAIAYVADLFSVPAIFIKAVTDIVDGDKPAAEEFLQNLAAVTAALDQAVFQVVDFINGKCFSEL